jgi:hypothetical protein
MVLGVGVGWGLGKKAKRASLQNPAILLQNTPSLFFAQNVGVGLILS